MSSAGQKLTEPMVIDEDVLIGLIKEQGPKGKAGQLFIEDGIKFDEIKEIRIEFLNILKIDHLWIMPNLVKLKLSNNMIENIENLETLVHLRELDLSFNRIRIMKNLNRLVKLEILLLYSNKITIVENIDDLQELAILSIGKNEIADWEHIMYLRKFKKLRSLNMDGNPCAGKEGYEEYLFAFLPQLVYYKYRRISNEERQSAIEKHYRVISNVEEKEAKEREKLDVQKQHKEKMILLSEAYVEYLDEDSLFQQMFENDKEGRDLSMVNEDTQSAFEVYRKTFSAISQELYERGIQAHQARMREIEEFNNTVNEGKETIQNEARILVDETIEKKTNIFAQIDELTKGILEKIETDVLDESIEKIQELTQEFNELMSTTWSNLMAKEVTLHDQIEDINEVFKINMTDMVETFLETAREYFARMRNAESEYNDTINGLVLFYLSGFGDEGKIPAHLLNVCGDKDILNNNLAASHDVHLQVIDDREDSMQLRLRNWLEEFIDQQVRDEVERNRRQILEISHFVDCQREELRSLHLLEELDLVDVEPDTVFETEL